MPIKQKKRERLSESRWIRKETFQRSDKEGRIFVHLYDLLDRIARQVERISEMMLS